ncbi:MAG: hypothetical protein K2O84_09895 [Oscillospiraceae bacterium]|nr:hypothetical protein [Oscillospiraceae bacterium]
MGPNRNHPDYPEYKKRWDALWKAMDIAVKASKMEEAKKQELPCMDGEPDAVRRKYMSQIAALQKEFKHLYE